MAVSRTQIFVLLATFACAIAGYFSFNFLLSKRRVNFHEQFYTQGYDFRHAQKIDDAFTRYKVGESVDLSKLRMLNGGELLGSSDNELILLSVVNPECIYCKLSQDIIDALRNDLVEFDVDYFPVMFVEVPDESILSEYSRSLGFSDILTWERLSRPPNHLISMPTPAHILLDRNGLILQVWFNSSRDEGVRKRMESQIVYDVSLISETYHAVAKRGLSR